MSSEEVEVAAVVTEQSALTAALAAVQAKLPEIKKDQKADAGQYSYNYADLAQITKAIMPLLAQNGLAWVCRPTFSGDRFVLAYELRHSGGESITGEYPLSGNTPQQIGSAVSYARRYCLCSVTGVAPESDDDDAQAARHHEVIPTRTVDVNGLRDRALAATSRDELTAIWHDARTVRAEPVTNEHGDLEELGKLIVRRGNLLTAPAPEPAAEPPAPVEAAS